MLGESQQTWREHLAEIASRIEDPPARSVLGRDGFDDTAARFGQKVDGANGVARLADAVRAPVALIEFDGVPGNVVMNDYACTLQVQPFGSEIGCDKPVKRSSAKGLDRSAAVARGCQSAMKAPRQRA